MSNSNGTKRSALGMGVWQGHANWFYQPDFFLKRGKIIRQQEGNGEERE